MESGLYLEPGEDETAISVVHQYTPDINWITSIGLLRRLSTGWDAAFVFDTIPCDEHRQTQVPQDQYQPPRRRRPSKEYDEKVCSVFCKRAYHREHVLDLRSGRHRIKHPLRPDVDDAVALRYTLATNDVPYDAFSAIGDNVKGLDKPLWTCLYCGFMYSRKCYGAWLFYGCCKHPHPLCVECFMKRHFPSKVEWDRLHPLGSKVPPPAPNCTNGCRWTEICLYPTSAFVADAVGIGLTHSSSSSSGYEGRTRVIFPLSEPTIELQVSRAVGLYCGGITLCAKPEEEIDRYYEWLDPTQRGQFTVTVENPGHKYLQGLWKFLTAQTYMEYNDLETDTRDQIEDSKDEQYAAWDALDPVEPVDLE
jgi:hypothetical protein